MDKGCEWQARRDSVNPSEGGDDLVANADEHWDNEEWQRYIPESKCFPSCWCKFCSFSRVSGSYPLYSFCGVSSSWSIDFTAEPPLLNNTSGLEVSVNLALGVGGGDFTLSSLVDGATKDNCWSNALRYKERRCCSKYTTSNSSTAISLINSAVGWSHKKKKESNLNKKENNIWTRKPYQILS